jgi:hypothetical protein
VASPGSNLTSIAKLRDHTVGVVGGEIHHHVVEALAKEYDLAHANVIFRDLAPAEARQVVLSKQVAALILVTPLTDKYIALIKNGFRESATSAPVLIPIDSAGAITDVKGPGFRRPSHACNLSPVTIGPITGRNQNENTYQARCRRRPSC